MPRRNSSMDLETAFEVVLLAVIGLVLLLLGYPAHAALVGTASLGVGAFASLGLLSKLVWFWCMGCAVAAVIIVYHHS